MTEPFCTVVVDDTRIPISFRRAERLCPREIQAVMDAASELYAAGPWGSPASNKKLTIFNQKMEALCAALEVKLKEGRGPSPRRLEPGESDLEE